MAVVVSLLLHMLVIFGVVAVRFETTPEPTATVASHPFALTFRQRIPPNQDMQGDGATPAQTLNPVLKSNNSGSASASPLARTDDPKPRTPRNTDEPLKTSSPVPTDTAPVLDETKIAQSIANYMATYRPQQQDNDPCPRYRQRDNNDNCPQESDGRGNQQSEMAKNINELFSSHVTGQTRNARAAQEKLAEMDRLRPLMNDKNPALAQVARASYYAAEEKFYSLTGGHKKSQFIYSVEERAAADSISIGVGNMSGK